MRSLRASLTISTASATLVVLAITGLAVYGLASRELYAQLDRSLLAQAKLLAGTVELSGQRLTEDFDELDLSEYRRQERPSYLTVWLSDGRPWVSEPLSSELPLPPAEVTEPVLSGIVLPDGRPGRLLQMRFLPRAEDQAARRDERSRPAPLALAIARDTLDIRAELAGLARMLTAIFAVAVVLLAATLAAVVRWRLRPLETVAAQIAQLDAADLGSRLEASRGPVEIVPLVERLNALLTRLAAAFERERAFSADVAHELRTPLAGLRTTIEVALSQPRPAAQYEASLADCLAVTEGLQSLVEGLLALSRLEARRNSPGVVPVDLSEALRSAWTARAATAAERGLTIEWDVASPCPVKAEPALLGLVVRNLLDNALAYADPGGAIRVETVAAQDGCRLRVANTGSRLTREQAEQAFQRFWRGDAARSGTGQHSGLGLALVRAAMVAMQGEVTAESEVGGEFAVAATWPGSGHDPTQA